MSIENQEIEDINQEEMPAIEPEIIAQDVDVAHRASKNPEGHKHHEHGHDSHDHDKKKPHHKHEEKQPEEGVEELKDQLLRKRAEFENYKKRVENEKLDFFKYAAEKVIVDILPILDSFDRALHPTNIPDESKSMYEGFSLIYKQMFDALVKQGMTEIKTENAKFDPNYHQAVKSEKVDGIEPGMIVKEYQKGYTLHKKVIRPSMVVVAE